jgi:hypothetical protein
MVKQVEQSMPNRIILRSFLGLSSSQTEIVALVLMATL